MNKGGRNAEDRDPSLWTQDWSDTSYWLDGLSPPDVPQVDLPPFTWDCRKLRTIGLSLQRRHGGRHMKTGTSSSRPQQKPALTTGRWQWRR